MDSSKQLPPSILICECLDGPYKGRRVRVGARASFIEVRDVFDDSKPRARYHVVDVDGHKELLYAPLFERSFGPG